jgi:hypothetical protein
LNGMGPTLVTMGVACGSDAAAAVPTGLAAAAGGCSGSSRSPQSTSATSAPSEPSPSKSKSSSAVQPS